MEIKFTNKEAQNKEQEKAFYKLTPDKRFERFFEISSLWISISSDSNKPKDKEHNFILSKF